MAQDKREMRETLIRKFGFEEVEGSRHEAIAFFHGDRKIATTRFSRGRNYDIDDGLLAVMAREVRVQTKNFLDGMISCQYDRDAFIARLTEHGFI